MSDFYQLLFPDKEIFELFGGTAIWHPAIRSVVADEQRRHETPWKVRTANWDYRLLSLNRHLKPVYGQVS